MRRTTFKYSILALWLLIASGAQAQHFGTTSAPTTATLPNATYTNPLLRPVGGARVQVTATKPNANVNRVNNTSVISSDLFKNKYRSSGYSGSAGGSGGGGGMGAGSGTNTTNYKTINTISAYQGISPGSINASAPGMRGGGPPPPPPTPGPNPGDENNQLPIGDAVWFMILLACGYGALLLKRRKA